MNTNGNTYTVIYSTVLVVLVAAILSFVAMSLQDKQNENVKMETISKVLTAAAESDPSVTVDETTNVMQMYADMVTAAFFVDGSGKNVESMELGKEDLNRIEVPTTADLKKQNDLLKKIDGGQTDLLGQLRLPVFIFDVNGTEIRVIPCYGAGLWGPIWGYLAVADDGRTIKGAIFDHKGETPGLGAKIAEPAFYDKFIDKAFSDADTKFAVVKGGNPEDQNTVDAISGATITSQALGKGINLWVKYYEPYLKTVAAAKTEKLLQQQAVASVQEDTAGEATINEEE